MPPTSERLALILSCEHAGNRVPARDRALLASAAARRDLATHRGSDLGALAVARALSAALHAPLHVHPFTRLLIDVNRSPHNAARFSRYTRGLAPAKRAQLQARLYAPYRAEVEGAIAAQVEAGVRVLHLSVHSFTPVLAGERRNADVGLLYDPSRAQERAFAVALQAGLRQAAPGLRVRRNYPYRGVADGFVPWLRRRFGAARYVGLELELNQGLVAKAGRGRDAVIAAVIAALRGVL